MDEETWPAPTQDRKGRSALGLQGLWEAPQDLCSGGPPMLPQDSVSWAWYRVPCCVTVLCLSWGMGPEELGGLP